jgi:predicted ATP-dependent protease
MSRLIASLREDFPKVFQSQEYQDQLKQVEDSFEKGRDRLTQELEEKAKEYGFTIEASRLGTVIIPLYKGQPITPEQLTAFSPSLKAEIQRKEKELHGHVHVFVHKLRALREETNRKIQELTQRIARYTSEHAFEQVREKYQFSPKILEYILAVQEDIHENVKDLGAPLIEEVNPTYNNLVGRIERKSQFGTLYTDFTLIKSGSLLQANGGYLLVNALDLLRNPFSWEALKRISKNREIKIEDIGELYGFGATSGIKPEPIPVRVRIILVGNPYLYYLLHAYDEDFAKIFKVKADFDLEQDRKDDAPLQYGRFIARLCREEGLLHFDRSAVAAALDQVSRWVSHQRKLSLQFSTLSDLVREADHWARRDGKTIVSREHVQRAVQEKIHRSNLLEERLREMITEGTLMVDLEGAVVGQINGLSVHDLGDFAFGRPSRITARVFLGRSGVVNIEREAKLSGKTHSKGVMILSGYLGGRYARENPLSLTGTLAFEQSYSEVEGDSASAAELLALLSSLSEIPLRQEIAVTGSVNQRGELQAIGGVNEKIEGFYAVCKAVRLTGRQGVIIPRQNIKHLALKEEVVKEVASGRFHVYAVSTVDEAMEILTGRPSGELRPDGTYPEGSVNAAVARTLSEMAKKIPPPAPHNDPH